MKTNIACSKCASNKIKSVFGATMLGFFGIVFPLHADFAYVPAGGRVSQVVTETGQRQVLTGWNLPDSGFVATDPTSGDLYTADQDDQAVYRIDRKSGIITLVSGLGIGSGPNFSARVYGIVVETNGNPVVVDGYGGLLAVIRVDAHTGNRVVLSAGSNSTVPAGTGAGFQSPFGIAIEPTGDFLVTDTLRNAVIRVDRISGNRSTASGDPFGDNVGSGPDMSTPNGITIGTNGLLFVSDSVSRIMSINPTDGTRTIVSSSAPTGGSNIYGLAFSTNGLLIAPYQLTVNSDSIGGLVYGIDPATGSGAPISTVFTGNFPWWTTRGTGPLFFQPIGVTVDQNGLIIISDVWLRSLLVIDPISGNRSILQNSRAGGGNDLYASKGIAIGTNGMIVVADDGNSDTDPFGAINNRYPALVQIDPNTGNRSNLSAGSNTDSPRGSGSNFDRPRGVARENSGTFLVADSGSSNPKVVRVDPASGNRVIVSSSAVGTGPNFVTPYGIAVESSGSFIVTDTSLNVVLRVDSATGNRTILSGSGIGSGTVFGQLRGVTVLQDGTIAVTDANLKAVLLVNGSSGNRTVLSSSSMGTGTTFTTPCGIAGTWQGDILVLDQSTEALFKVNRNTGNRTLVSSASTGSGPSIESSPEFLTDTPPLMLTSPQRLIGGTNQFNLYSPIGRKCVIEVSSNLIVWTQLTNLTTISTTNMIADGSAVSQQTRFYRAKMLAYNPAAQSLQITINPAGAINAGAQWQMDGGAWQNSGTIISGFTVGSHAVGLSSIGGWMAPTNQTVTINANQLTTTNMTYVLIPDSTRPTCQLTTPTAGLSVSNANYTVTGTATDNVYIANVRYQLNGTGWNLASTGNGWSNWTASVSLNPQTNVIQACAVDVAGNVSTTNTVSFVCILNTPLIVSTNGLGSISPNYNGKLLTVGKSYSVTAAAGTGFTFSNWTGGVSLPQSVLTNGLTLKFVMQSNLWIQANFRDSTKPTLTVTSPANNSKVTNATATVIGTASDNLKVAGVWCQSNGGMWNTATTSNNFMNWSAQVPLITGNNTIKSYAQDSAGNFSTTNSRTVTH